MLHLQREWYLNTCMYKNDFFNKWKKKNVKQWFFSYVTTETTGILFRYFHWEKDTSFLKFLFAFPEPFADISVSQTPSYPPSENGEVELFCNVYSAGRTFPFVYWVRNSKIIRKGRQLKMSMLSERDEGNYTCSAKDDRGVVTNLTHFLRIMCKVILITQRHLKN